MSNFHATDHHGRNFKTKKALREAIAANPSQVIFSDTSGFSNRGVFVGTDNLRPSDVIVGPDPYRDRRWYANVKNGKVV